MEPIRRRKNSLTTDSTTAEQRSFTFEELITLFSSDRQLKNCTPRTIQFYQENLQYLQKVYEIKGNLLDISFITPNHLKLIVIGYMMEKGLSSYTINGRMKTYKVFFKFLAQEGYREDDISAAIPLVKSEQKMIPSFSKQQALELLNQPNRNTFVGLRDYTMMMVLLETGIRIQELLSLQIQDVVFSENELRVHVGKGRKARRVPFQKTCANVLKMYIRERGKLQTNVLFVTLGNRPIHPRTIQENIHEYGKKAKISGVRVSPHTFRHSMAKFYLLNGGDAFTLQQILGHSSLDMVKLYVNLFRSDIQEQHRKYSPVENIRL
jgi:integrase/recombinase XerD